MNDIDLDEFRKRCANLSVYIKGEKIGTLEKLGQGKYSFTYLEGVSPLNFVSLGMPVRRTSWVSETGLHSFFQMNLPEGALAKMMAKRFGKSVTSDPLTMLGLVGNSTLGGVRFAPEGMELEWRTMPSVDVDKIMNEVNGNNASHQQFMNIMSSLAGQGISGVMPKMLVTSDNITRYTLANDEWILKHDIHSVEPGGYEGVSLNEYLTLKAVSMAGLDVAQTKMSVDGHTLAIRRFDGNQNGKNVRFEDACSIFGLSSHDKYNGTMERLAFVVDKISSNPTLDKEVLARAHALNMIVGNGDAHLKNFGFVYTERGAVRLSPIFDVVTVKSFDQQVNDIPALSLNKKREWSLDDDFFTFATSDCGLPPKKIIEIIETTINAVQATMPLVAQAAENFPWFREQAKRMLVTWNEGVSMALGEPMPRDSDILNQFKMSAIVIPQEEQSEPEQFVGGLRL